MGWADRAIQTLRQGQAVTIYPRGHSMRGRIESGSAVHLAPVTASSHIEVGDVVLCVVRGRQYVHEVQAARGARYLIGNRKGGVNGWVGRSAIFGMMVE